MNSKSFIFGKNYDSDYLSAKRFKRKNYDHKYDKTYRIRRRRTVDHREDNPINRYPNERNRKQVKKIYDNRLTLKSRPNDSLADDYHKYNGLYANGKTSNIVNNERVGNNDRNHSNARFKEDLFWILHQKNSESEEYGPPLKTKHSLRYRPTFVEKETQINKTISLDDSTSDGNSLMVANKDRHHYRSVHLSQNKQSLFTTNIFKTPNSCLPKSLAKLKVKNKLNCVKANDYNRSQHLKSSHSRKVMPSLPTSMKIVQNLMNSYENERKVLSKDISEFGIDLIIERCNHLKQISKSCNQSIEENLTKKQFGFKVTKQTIDSQKVTKDITNRGSVPLLCLPQPLPIIPYNQNEMQIVLKQLEPRVGNMLSRLLLNISEAFQTLSSKCIDKSFFE